MSLSTDADRDRDLARRLGSYLDDGASRAPERTIAAVARPRAGPPAPTRPAARPAQRPDGDGAMGRSVADGRDRWRSPPRWGCCS